jgi:hypothetical protein
MLVDLQLEMLQKVRGKLARAGLGNVGFAQANSTALPLPSGAGCRDYRQSRAGFSNPLGECIPQIDMNYAVNAGGTRRPGSPACTADLGKHELCATR